MLLPMMLPKDFNWETYLELNEDLKKKKIDKSKAEIHYLKHGLKENRKYKYEIPNDFVWTIYLEVNKDLKEKITTEENAVKHYLKFGIKEKRKYKVFIPNNFDWETYLVINPDVKEHGYDSEEKSKNHYLTYGFFENRTFAWSMDILQNYIKDDDNLFEKITGNNDSFHLSDNNNINKIDFLVSKNDVKDFSEDNYFSELEHKNIKTINEEICYYTKNKLSDFYTDSFILIVDFPNMGGGAQQFLSSILSNYKKNQTFLILRNIKNKLEISINDDYIFDKNMNETEIIEYIGTHKNKISKIFINHILKHTESLLNKIFELGKETTTITHDYNLICNIPQPFYHEINKCLRPNETNYISKCNTIIMQNKCNYCIFEPFLSDKNKVVITSLPDCKKSLNKIITNNKKIVIGVIGFISNKKGSLLIRHIIQKFEKEEDIEIINFGCLNLTYNKSFKYTDLEEFNELLIQYQPNLLIETSLWPETYSYTLSLGMLTQLPILSVKKNFDGVIQERLSRYDKAHFFYNFTELKSLIYKVKQDYFYTVEPVFYYNSFWDNYFINPINQNSISSKEEVEFKNIKNKNVVFITSKIHVSKNKFSYIDNRSIYTSEERLIQTIETIESIRKYIPDSYIILLDNSVFNPLEKSFFKKLTDSFINIIDNEELNFYTDNCEIKAFSDISQQVAFLDLFLKNKEDENENKTQDFLSIRNFFKISGRYLVNSDYDFNKYDNDKNIFKRNNYIPQKEYFYTCFYKLDKNILMEYHDKLKKLLKTNFDEWKGDMDCEVLLPNLIKESITEENGLLGITQRVAVWNDTSKI